jgi:hypothetical protein
MDLLHASGFQLKRDDEVLGGIAHEPERQVLQRGVGWVLRWAAAIAVIWIAGCVLAEFWCSLTAEHMLARAARAGALEATLPRATHRTVVEAVTRRLANRAWTKQMTLSVQQNGTAIGGMIRATGGDRMAVTMVAPARSVLPPWLSFLSFHTNESQIEVRAEREIPGRLL